MSTLNPWVTLGEEQYILMPQLMAPLTMAELNERVGSLKAQRDEIVRAIDALLSRI